MADALRALVDYLDDLDRPLWIRMRHAPDAAAQRLLDTLGVLVLIDLSAPVCVERCGRAECLMSAAAAFEPNWISYRHSLVQVDKRRDADDETLEICPYCECEVDVTPVPHRPDCRGIGKPRASSATVISAPSERKPPAAAPVPRRPVEAVDVDDEEEDDELELDEETDALGPDVSSSSPELEEEVAAVGDLAVSSAAESPSPGELERAATTSTLAADDFTTRRRRRKPYTRDEILAAFHRFHDEHGRWPLKSDIKTCAYLPSGIAEATRAVSGFASWQAVWDELGAGKVPTGQGARKYAGRPVVPGRVKKPPAAATSSRSRLGGWITVPGTGLAYRNPDEAYVAADEIEADGERVAQACREDGNDERADLAVDQAHELAEKIRAAARAADERQAAAAAPPGPEPRDDHERDARAVDASPPAAAPTAPATGPDGALEAPPGEVKLLVSPSEMDGLQRAMALAAIAAARAFADTLEQELAA